MRETCLKKGIHKTHPYIIHHLLFSRLKSKCPTLKEETPQPTQWRQCTQFKSRAQTPEFLPCCEGKLMTSHSISLVWNQQNEKRAQMISSAHNWDEAQQIRCQSLPCTSSSVTPSMRNSEEKDPMQSLRNPETPEGDIQCSVGIMWHVAIIQSQHKEQILISCLMTRQGWPPLCFSIFLLCETEREQTQLRCTIQSIKQLIENQFQERREGKEGKKTREHVKRNWVALSSATSQNHNMFCSFPERRVRRRLLHNSKLLLQVSSVVFFFP